MRRRLLAAAAALAVAASGAVATGAGAQARLKPGYPKLTWTTCTDSSLLSRKAECGFVTVPLDYKKPDGETIELAVSRIKHTVPEKQYQGIMLVNPGGPGAKGQGLSVIGSLVPKEAGSAYDWIGFDPRGVGASKPSLSCDSDYAGYNRPEYVPTTTAIETAWLKRTEKYAKDCAAAGGELLDHLRTQDTVRDMESIRLVLGATQINFYGFSYGTYLGQVYSTMFPSRVRRMVLDGNVNPTRVWYDSNLDQDLAFDKNIKIYFAWVAKYDRIYHLGRTGKAVERLYYSQRARLAKKPAGGKIGSSEFTDVLLQAGYYVFGWEEIAQAFSDWVRKRDPEPLKKLYDKNNSLEAGGDNGYAMYLATQCSDVQWPLSWTKWTSDNWETHRRAPFETWANAWYNAPCRTWAGKPGIPTTVSGETVAPILLISETFDAATPFSGSLEVRKRFPRSALVEGVGGTTHAGSLFGDECVDNTIADYLATGALPKRKAGERSDKRCEPVPAPEPGSGPVDGKGKRAEADPARAALERAMIQR
ncbi:alpha/beta hydrolase [Paractinoplanes ferrugineus]|uniref:Peptidase n=1 Tax=Paractinoplanes ferrugineus TaxID=113564 RepID=A0A919M8A1_9ACTN|nr:alpha/beta hydrolase [Actinoplanes ferrugineus]GIE10261.1 peptidase [Actinoplanes ferrugineus]